MKESGEVEETDKGERRSAFCDDTDAILRTWGPFSEAKEEDEEGTWRPSNDVASHSVQQT